MLDIYKHRASTYQKRAGYVDIANVQTLFNAKSPVTTQPEDEIFTLPPKLPTPNVILRNDIMPKQRTHNIL